jgi:threonine dehydrogenase-like Zn-dependent dehydrogenase
MKAVIYQGPRQVSVSTVADARIEKPTDVLVRISTTNICGSDLHMYEGRTSFETGRVFGHENLGQVIEVGAGVDRVKQGDWVCLPFNVACGFCDNCERGFTGFCLTCNPGMAGAAYGFAEMGPYQGGGAAARALRRFQLPGAAEGRSGEGRRLRHAVRHLPHRLACHGTRRTAAG